MFRNLILGLISFYQLFVSPFLPRACRFHPTCSHYTKESFCRYPFFKALRLSVCRFFRCHPFCDSGFDPVP